MALLLCPSAVVSHYSLRHYGKCTLLYCTILYCRLAWAFPRAWCAPWYRQGRSQVTSASSRSFSPHPPCVSVPSLPCAAADVAPRHLHMPQQRGPGSAGISEGDHCRGLPGHKVWTHHLTGQLRQQQSTLYTTNLTLLSGLGFRVLDQFRPHVHCR